MTNTPSTGFEGAQPALQHVHLLATGGTIAGVQRRPMDAGYEAGGFKVEDLLLEVPQIGALARITGEQLASIGSQNMSDALWLTLARRINSLFASAAADAVVVLHGTDTMEETAFFLNLTTQTDRPIVMVGAMRPATAVSADGPANLYGGVLVASHPESRGRGVLVCFNNEIHHARNIVKADTTSLQSFLSPRRGLAGVVHADRVDWFERIGHPSREVSRYGVEGLKELPRVDILYAHAGMNSDLVPAAIRLGAKGLVIAGVGAGNMPSGVIAELAKAVRDGIVVVRSTRLQNGMVLRNIEIDDDANGFVASGDLNAAKSRVLLQLALTRTSQPDQVQQIFQTS